MKYTRIIVLALMALLMVGTADAQGVSVRRTNRNQNSSSGPSTSGRNNKNQSAGRETSKNDKPAGSAARNGNSNAAKSDSEPQEQGSVVKSITMKKKSTSDPKAPAFADGKSLRQRNFDEYLKENQDEKPWQHVVYRELDLTVEKNASLYYPVEPQEGLESLFHVIIKAYASGELKAYEYLGDREILSEKYLTKRQEILDKFEIPYTIQEAKGRNAEESYLLDEVELPSHEVLYYYVKERWEFDQAHSRYVPRVLCLCPVLYRTDEDGSTKARYPMFWVNFEDLRPFLREHRLVSAGFNQAPRYSMEEFFTLNMYEGVIYKEQNLLGLTLQQQYPNNPDSVKIRQKEIDDQLRNFGKQIWEEEAPVEKSVEEKPKKKENLAEENLVKTGRKDRRTKEEVVVDSVAVAAKAKKPKSVRR